MAGHLVCVEGGRILRGYVRGRNGTLATAYPYRKNPCGGWYNDAGVTVSSFRYAVNRGIMKLMQEEEAAVAK